MKPPTTLFRLVGVRANGERVVISTNGNLPMAEKTKSLILHGTDYKEILLESNGDGTGPWKQHGKKPPPD